MCRVVYGGCPILIYKPVAEYPSITAAAKAIGVSINSLRSAVENGVPCQGVHARYADMPETCQPIKPPKRRRRRPIVWEGTSYDSIMEAAGGDRTQWMRIWRSVKRAPTP